MASLDVDAYSLNGVNTIEAEYWITNARATDANGVNTLTISSNRTGITEEDGIPVTELAPEIRNNIIGYETTVFGHARVLSGRQRQIAYRTDRSTSGTEIDAIRYHDSYRKYFEYHDKETGNWKRFDNNDQLVFYYLVRTDYSRMVQIDVSDWTVDDEPSFDDRRSVTYQVYVKGADGSYTRTGNRKFWYNKTFTVSSVLVRQTDADHYTIDSVALDPFNLGNPTKNENGEYQFSIDLSQTDGLNATVKIYVTPKVQPHKLKYVLNGGIITSDAGTYTPEGPFYPDQAIIVPEIEKEGFIFEGWFDEKTGTEYKTNDAMPDNDLTLTAKWTKETPNPEPEPNLTPAKYFVLLPTRGTPQSGASQGWTSYLPNTDSDGGVIGANRDFGYPGGHLTEVGKQAAFAAYDKDDEKNGVFDDKGFGDNYLVPPTDLGFFDKKNWTGNTYTGNTRHKPTEIEDLLKTDKGNFDVSKVHVVWYAIKYQADEKSYHVDGYVAGMPVTVTYHSNDSAISDAAEKTSVDDATSGDTYAVLDNMFTVPNGYTFGGWYTDRGCSTGNECRTTTLMDRLDLYAKWVPINSEVSYFYQDERGTEKQFGGIDTYAFGTDVTVRTAHPEKEGYKFTGWKNIKNIVAVDATTGKFTMPAQAVRFDATFEINHYNVIYKVDNKEVGTDVYDFNHDVVIRPVPTKEGYTFKGWKTNDVTVDADGKFKMPAKAVTIEGTFAINRYNVTYKVDNEVVGTDVYDFNHDVVIRPVPTKEGYTFSGWKIGNADAENFKMPAHAVTIEGTFAKNSSGGSSGGHHRRPTVTIPDEVPTGLNGDDHYAYIVGYPDKTVRPQNGITRAEVATIFFRLLTDETRNANSTKSNSYSDVAAGAWYNHAVSTLSAMGIVKGDSDGKFNPNASITRAEFAAIAARFDDNANTSAASFSDIANHWAKDEISAAANNGWITGYTDGTFRPNNRITRAEAMALVNRVLKRLPETDEDLHADMIKWSDNSDASQWYYLDVQEATNSHYYQTKENQLEKWTELRDTRDWTELEK